MNARLSSLRKLGTLGKLGKLSKLKLTAGLTAALISACTGQIEPSGRRSPDPKAGASAPEPGVISGGPASAPPPAVTSPGVTPPGGPAPGAPAAFAPTQGGLRRLSRAELDATLRDLLLDETAPASRRLSEENVDVRFGFDNDQMANRDPSLAYVEALDALVADSVRAALADPKRRARVLPCEPKDTADAACWKDIVARFGRRALRRPLLPEETALYEGFAAHGKTSGNVWTAVEGLLRALLLSPEFAYRFELGAPTAPTSSVHELSPFEVASRLSFALWGTTPDDALLDEAARGTLATTAGVRDAATRLLQDPRARQRVRQFHAQWLGYTANLPPGFGAAFLEESNALVDDVVFDNPRDHRDLFLSSKTFIGPQLRQHYKDVAAPASDKAGWVDYGGSGRRGILSHGSVLQGFRTGDDTSITKRGLFIRLRLLCEDVPEPPPNVSVDVGAAATECKTGPNGFFAKSHQGAACKACHDRLDPLGFGLERFDMRGALRVHDTDKPNCPIDDRGSVLLVEGETAKTITFQGPGQLGKALADSGRLDACVVAHAYRFALGRHERSEDEPALHEIAAAYQAAGRDFKALLLALVTHPAFLHRNASAQGASVSP